MGGDGEEVGGDEFAVQRRGWGEPSDTMGEVAEGIALAAEELGDPRHEMKKIKIPEKSPGVGWGGEFEQG